METNVTTKKSLMGRLGKFFKKEPKAVREPVKPHIPQDETPTQSPAPAPLEREDSTPKLKVSAEPTKRKKMRDLYPGYKGPNITPSSPSPATLAQRRQRAARKLQRGK